VITSADPDTGQAIRIERRNQQWQWEPASTVVLLAHTTGSGCAAEYLCPSITFHATREHAQHHLRSRAELRGAVVDQQDAIRIASLSFGSLLTAAS
jgi:alkylmercury lyase